MEKERFTSGRKLDHLRICLDEQVESGWSGFSDIRLVHNALPDVDMDELSLSTTFLGRSLSSPLLISAMTGGHPETKEVNCVLGMAAEKYNLAIGTGSQRAAIEDPSLEDTFAIIRDVAPHAFVIGNLGIVQLRDHGVEWAERAVEMVDADALAIHLNFLQEAIQPEGDHDASGCYDALEELCTSFSVPVVLKETGCGISRETAMRGFAAGVKAVDTGGFGGSSWALIESYRANQETISGKQLHKLGSLFADWGIPTAVCLAELQPLHKPVIAGGGLRTGVDIAKSLALGATLGGMALPLLQPACDGMKALCETIDVIHHELLVSMFLTGSRCVRDLSDVRYYMYGITRQILSELSF
ncbi:MAG: type 2 isopentenyl-diphosphate Delta-isomerase [Methanomicrobiales archaeon]|nr:type 2 isopentenyl-diphosphate Delta-isomerase [Methanomicrobiales archaeon]